MNNQARKKDDITFTVRSDEHRRQPQSNPSNPIIDLALNAMATALLNMHDTVIQAMSEIEDAQKQNPTVLYSLLQ